jgi:hypothetical protein
MKRGCSISPLAKKDGSMLRIFERRTLRMIYVPINDNGIWRRRYNTELYMLYDELCVVKKIKIGT